MSTVLSWRPSFWFDEAATIAAANRSQYDILRLLLNFDAVHGLYYLGMHAWLSRVPIDEFTARFPSAVAVGIAAAGMIVLGKLVADRPTAWAAAVGFTVLPRTLWSAVEARSYALTAAIAVWLTVVLVIAAGRGGAALWALYSFTVAAAVISFVYLGLLVFAHAATLALGRNRRQLLPFAIAAGAGLVLAAPLIALTAGQQRQQLWWITGPENGYLAGVLWEQWFTRSRLFGCACVVVLAWAAVALVTRRAGGAYGGLAVALPWITVPTGLLVGYSALVHDVYQPRYLTYTAPGVGLLLGVCVVAIARERSRILLVLLVILALSAGTAFVEQRGRYAKPGGADYSQIADLIGGVAKPHDCVVFGFAGQEPLRASAAARPDAFAALRDVAAGVSGADAAQLWTQDLPLGSDIVKPRLAACPVLWAVVDRWAPAPVVDAAKQQGFAVDRQWTLNRSIVVRLKRS